MKSRYRLLSILLAFVLLTGIDAHQVSAGTTLDEPCTIVSFYLYNALDETVMIDLVNWTTGTRWLHTLDPMQSARFSMPEGVFEFYIDPAGVSQPYWYVSAGASFHDCNQVAGYIKLIEGLPFLRIKDVSFK